MQNGENDLQPIFSHAEPVLAVENVSETILYWHNVLGFPNKWTWGKPPNHGGVSWNGAFIQFSQNPQLAVASKGNSIWIRVRRIEILYRLHQKQNAEIVAPLKNQSWGMTDYTVREINGYFVHFAGAAEDRGKSAAVMPGTIRIIARTPAIQEARNLAVAIGASMPANDAMMKSVLEAAVFAVVAEDTLSGEVIGSALLVGDNASFYYVKDVMVHPAWQGKRVGTAMMRELNHWLDDNGASNALVGLIARETLEPFYQQFGFVQAFSMLRYIERSER
ncbi:MAG TPA: GNAT family N-acetyltransferase [Chitinophagaceae bacterium]|jgi:GNAT superfamily N-acetyltransferase